MQVPYAATPDLLTRALESRFDNPTLAVVLNGVISALDDARRLSVEDVIAEVPPEYALLVGQLATAPIPFGRESEIGRYIDALMKSVIDRELLRQKAELRSRQMRVELGSELWRTLSRAIVDIDMERVQLQD